MSEPARLWRRLPGNKKDPRLTRDTRELSELLLNLDDIGRERAAETIQSIIHGIRTLGELPDEVVDNLWGILCTVARKAICKADPDKMMNELEDGLDDEIKDLIIERSRVIRVVVPPLNKLLKPVKP